MEGATIGLIPPALELGVVGLTSPVLEMDIAGLPFSGEDATRLVAPTTGDWLPLPRVGSAAVVVGRIPPFVSVSDPVSDNDNSDVAEGCPSPACGVMDACPLAELCESVGLFPRGVIEATVTEGTETDSCVAPCAVLDGDC